MALFLYRNEGREDEVFYEKHGKKHASSSARTERAEFMVPISKLNLMGSALDSKPMRKEVHLVVNG